MRPALMVAVVLIALPAAVLGYGYWFGRTHGALLVSVTDVSDRDHPFAVIPVQLSFRDGAGRQLAEARGLPSTGAILLTAPPLYACHEVETRAPFSVEAGRQWQECFARQSRWLPGWIRNVRAVTLRSDTCTIEQLPIAVAEYPDTWWLWWVPLRHIGGKPYTSFSVRIELEHRAGCTARDAGR